jgi:hypothetical protein
VTTGELEIEALKSLIFESTKSNSALLIALIKFKRTDGRVNCISFYFTVVVRIGK